MVEITRYKIDYSINVSHHVRRRQSISGPPKPSKAIKIGASPTGEQRAPTSNAAQAHRTSSKSAAARDESFHTVQAVAGALSAFQVSVSSGPPFPTPGAAGVSSLASADSANSVALVARVGPSGAAQGALLAPSSSRSSRTHQSPKNPLANPGSREKRATQLSGSITLESRAGSAPHTVGEAEPSSSAGLGGSVSGGSGRAAAFLSSGIRESPTVTTPTNATRHTRQGEAARSSDPS